MNEIGFHIKQPRSTNELIPGQTKVGYLERLEEKVVRLALDFLEDQGCNGRRK